MGYRVIAYPPGKPSGGLALGRVVTPPDMGTWHHHPSGAEKVALSWVAKNPGGYCQVVIWGDDRTVVKEVR